MHSEFTAWRDELAGARLVGHRWVRTPKPFGWLAAIVIAVLAGPALFTAAILLTQTLAASGSGASAPAEQHSQKVASR